ncbi:BTB POZ domain containing [Fusarium albosuccineum]|uniref:BTB POZ domain containing n=1 Tax=Fusarium albosuccineum TaxID=1237068 RepID=A0A8H4LMT3_9HYPO|nr:BTB POZ domain containing [Fusarium albosuccineum]
MRTNKDEAVDLGGRPIQVVVGSSTPVTFSVHQKVICASSDLFKKAVLGGWRDPDEGLVRLESDSPDVFNVDMQWLYYRTIPVPIDEPGIRGNAEYILLAKAFVLEDMLQDGGFQDAVMDAMVDKTPSEASDGQKWFPVIRFIYEKHARIIQSETVPRRCIHIPRTRQLVDGLGGSGRSSQRIPIRCRLVSFQ